MHFRRPIALFALALITISTTGCKYILVPTYVAENIEGLEPSDLAFNIFNDKSQILGQILSESRGNVPAYYGDGVVYPVPDFLGVAPEITGVSPSGGVLVYYGLDIDGEYTVISGVYDDQLFSVLRVPEMEGSEHLYLLMNRSPGGLSVGVDFEIPLGQQMPTKRMIIWDAEGNYTHLNHPWAFPTSIPTGQSIFINDNRTVVASTRDQNVRMWRDGSLDSEPVVVGDSTIAVATGLTKDNITCGYQISQGEFSAWVYNGSLTLLNELHGKFVQTLALGMNDKGHIVGAAADPDSLQVYLVQWRKQKASNTYVAVDMAELLPGLTPWPPSSLRFSSINNRGEIAVGYSNEVDGMEESIVSLLRPKGITLIDTTKAYTQATVAKSDDGTEGNFVSNTFEEIINKVQENKIREPSR